MSANKFRAARYTNDQTKQPSSPTTARALNLASWPRGRGPGRVCEPYALLDLERYDDGTAAVAVVVSPAHRRQGIAASVLRSIFDLPEIAGVDEIFAEVEQGNTAGVRLVFAAGLVPEARGTADEGFDRFVVRRDLSSASEPPPAPPTPKPSPPHA
jgi:GNAT superfamily N-acetyltransferase